MPSHDNHGLRRAIFSRTSGKGRHRAASSPVPRPRGRGQKLAFAAAVTGMIGMTVLSTAHAAPTGILAMGEVPASAVAAPAAQPSLLADAGSSLVFDQPQVKSSPAAKAARKAAPKAARKAASKPVRKPALKAAPKPVRKLAPKPARASAPSAGLRAPLASTIVTSPYGHRVNPLTGAIGELHTGLDFAGACGTPVLAAARGKVTEAGWSPYGGGNRIVVDHGKGLKTTYNHLASIGVSKGQTLAQGGRIAAVGTTGSSTGCHLHFEVMVNNRTVNPASYL
ncbi:M23 family metallopeptidase [Arthrobacter sp. NPDC093139]|uniref:M23 family metallopeptidase n=1 Tax=Arthrobacter sp. NPDC093139 TaxID=3363945 RepID=UPI0037F278C8